MRPDTRTRQIVSAKGLALFGIVGRVVDGRGLVEIREIVTGQAIFVPLADVRTLADTLICSALQVGRAMAGDGPREIVDAIPAVVRGERPPHGDGW